MLVVSPDERNLNIRTVIIAPMTTAAKDYPTRVSCMFKKKQGQIVLDQIRTIDKSRLVKRLGTIDPKSQSDVVSILQRMFAF
jgi:mRNA interferase MazF